MRRFATVCFAMAIGMSASGAASAALSPYQSIIEEARKGQTAPALTALHQMYLKDPYNPRVVYDYLVVSTWAGDDARAIKLYEVLSPGKKPAYVMEAAAKAYRDTKNYDKALQIYQQGQAAYPTQPGFVTGKILTLNDSGQSDQAIRYALSQPQFSKNEDVTLALANAYQTKGDDANAAVQFQKLEMAHPGRANIVKPWALALSRAGHASQAIQIVNHYRADFTDDDLRQIQAQSAAELIRKGEQAPASDNHATTDQAINNLNALIASWKQQGPAAADDVNRARFDRMIALRDRTRMDDVVKEYESMHSQNVAIPAYVKQAAADAYLYNKQPDQAALVYKEQIAADPGNTDAKIGLFYCLIEEEEFDDAFALIDKLNEQQPALPAKERVRTELIAARARQYGDDLPNAEGRLQNIIKAAPQSEEAHAALGDVYLAEGQPRAATTEYNKAKTLGPVALDHKIGDANTSFALRDYELSEHQTQSLLAQEPDNRAVQRLGQQMDVYDRPELQVRVGQAFRSDNTPNNEVGTNEFYVGSRLYSAPIDYHYRPYIGADYSTDKLRDGHAESQHYLAGLQYKAPNWLASGEVSENSYGGNDSGNKNDFNRVGAALEGAYDLSDIWQVGARGEIFSADTPLKALRDDITANSGSIYAVYHPRDTRTISGRVELLDFSDDNAREFGSLNWLERVYNEPHIKIDWRSSAYGSHNSKDNTPYFNPKNDFELATGPEFTQILYRHYQFVYEHILTVQPGYYWQDGFDSGFVGTATYQHRIRANDDIDAGLGVTLSKQRYDGEDEDGIVLFADMDWKF